MSTSSNSQARRSAEMTDDMLPREKWVVLDKFFKTVSLDGQNPLTLQTASHEFMKSWLGPTGKETFEETTKIEEAGKLCSAMCGFLKQKDLENAKRVHERIREIHDFSKKTPSDSSGDSSQESDSCGDIKPPSHLSNVHGSGTSRDTEIPPPPWLSSSGSQADTAAAHNGRPAPPPPPSGPSWNESRGEQDGTHQGLIAYEDPNSRPRNAPSSRPGGYGVPSATQVYSVRSIPGNTQKVNCAPLGTVY